jgi:hypothetical protein
MRRVFRGVSPEPRSGSSSGDELDEDIWHRLSVIFAAAHRGDPDQLADLWLKLEREVSEKGRDQAAVYLRFLLEYRVIEILGRRPTVEDLHELSISTYTRYRQVIREDEEVLEDLLGTVFKFLPPERYVKGARFMVLASAAVGVLLDDPASQLDAIRPPLARWYRRHENKLRELGMN